MNITVVFVLLLTIQISYAAKSGDADLTTLLGELAAFTSIDTQEDSDRYDSLSAAIDKILDDTFIKCEPTDENP